MTHSFSQPAGRSNVHLEVVVFVSWVVAAGAEIGDDPAFEDVPEALGIALVLQEGIHAFYPILWFRYQVFHPVVAPKMVCQVA